MKAQYKRRCRMVVCLDCPRRFDFGYVIPLAARHADAHDGHRILNLDLYAAAWNLSESEIEELIEAQIESIFGSYADIDSPLPMRYMR